MNDGLDAIFAGAIEAAIGVFLIARRRSLSGFIGRTLKLEPGAAAGRVVSIVAIVLGVVMVLWGGLILATGVFSEIAARS